MPKLKVGSTVSDQFWKRVNKATSTGCWLWTGGRGGSKNEYGRFAIGHRIMKYAHRFSWELHKGVIPDGLQVCHHCDVPLCVNPDHLFLGTQADNDADRDRKGRVAHGQRHYKSSLTDEQIIEMRVLRSKNIRLETIAEQFGVCVSSVCVICSGRTRLSAGGPITQPAPCKKNAKRLSEEEAAEVCRLYANGDVSQDDLAVRFGVRQTSISRIVLGRSHKA